MDALNIAIAGLGTVGAEVARQLLHRKTALGKAAGRPLILSAVSARNATKDRGFSMAGIAFEANPVDLAARADVDVIIELIGGSEGPAKELVEAALKAGKHVITANKALIAHHGQTLAESAEEQGLSLKFEAAVAGGIPALKTLREGLAANEIQRICGILNGTCNYILTEMARTGRDFADVLQEAQAKGYAEADPTFDVDGIDAAHKLAILTALAFSEQVDFEAIPTVGIRHIAQIDIQHAAELGYEIKLLGMAEQGSQPSVQPWLLPADTQLAKVSGALNAVEYDAEPVQNIICVGPGAGAGPTASAVLADLMDVCRRPEATVFGRAAHELASAGDKPPQNGYRRFYLRLKVADKPGVLSEITAVLRDHGLSVASMLQKDSPAAGSAEAQPVSLVITTHRAESMKMQAALGDIAQLTAVFETPTALPILDTDTLG